MPLRFQNRVPFRLAVVLSAVLALASIAMMAVYVNEGPYGPFHSVQSAFRSAFTPFGVVGEATGSAVGDLEAAAADATADEETLSALKAQNAKLIDSLAQAEEYRLENERLRELLDIRDNYDIQGVAARVIGRSTDAWNRTLTLDVGSSDGIAPGLTVIGGGGVVGQVVSASGGSCIVRLIDDPQSGVSAIVQSSRAEGIVRGSLSGQLYLEDIDSEVEIQVGDIVLTSGLGGSYAKGLLIGTIVRIDGREGDDMRRIIVSQNADISSLEEAVVVFSVEESDRSDEVSFDEYEDGDS